MPVVSSIFTNEGKPRKHEKNEWRNGFTFISKGEIE